MKLAVPSETDAGLASHRSGHFGHAPYFTIVTIEDGSITAVESIKSIDHDSFGCGGVIDYAISLGIDAMLAAGMGLRPLTRFTDAGIAVYSETASPIVGDAVEKFIKGECHLMAPEEACVH